MITNLDVILQWCIELLLPVYFFVILIGSQFNTFDKKFLNVVPSINNHNIDIYIIII